MADILASVAGVRLAGLPFAGGPGAARRRGRVNPLECILPASRRGESADGAAWGAGGPGNVFQRCWSAASLGGRRSWHRLDYGGCQVVADILGRFGVFARVG